MNVNISFGMITKHFDSYEPINSFLDNATKNGHKIYSIIIAYSHSCNWKIVEKLKNKVEVFVVKINNEQVMKQQLFEMGVSNTSIKILLNCSTLEGDGIVSYGLYRNYVVMKALLTGTDILVFVDTDVYPKILIKECGEVVEKEIDFIGRHLEYIKEDDVIITTSDYSGYYIIPPMKFNGMKELFIGLQKQAAYEYLIEHEKHNCLNVDNYENRKVFETNKILGGNVAIKLNAYKELPPFFSTVYGIGHEKVLARGEDTLLGLKLNKLNKKCIDIDTKIFHNTYGNYPEIPDIKKDKSIKDRFYYACLGWIGRNPFLNWLMDRDIEKMKKIQLENIEIGSKAIADYLDDKRFLILPEALEVSYNRLNLVIDEYKTILKCWNEFVDKLWSNGGVMSENIDSKSFPA